MPEQMTEPQPPSDAGIVMIVGLALIVFCSDWRWGLVGAILVIGGLLVGLAQWAIKEALK